MEANNKAVLEDVGHDANLYIANQEDNTRKIRRLASAELCATSKYEVVGCLSRCIVVSSLISISIIIIIIIIIYYIFMF